MGAFYTTAAALPDLALLLLAVLIVVYFALRKEKAPGTGWLIALMVGQVGLHAVNFTAAGAYGGWAVHVNALILAFPLLLLWAMLGFAYHFLGDPYPRESRWVLGATGLLTGAQVVGHVAWGFMAPGPLLEPLRQALLVTAPFLLLVVLWTVVVMVRRAARRGADASEARAFRALLLIELCSVVALAALVLRDAGVVGPFVWRQVTLLVTTVYLLGFVTVYANFVPQPTTFQVKVVGFALAVLLAALGTGAMLAYDAPAWAGAPPPQGVRFTPDGEGRYLLTREPAPLDTAVGAPLGMHDGLGVRVPLGFAFPFAGRDWDAVFVDDDGFVSFGSTFQLTSLAAPLGMRTPWIGPLVADLDPHDGGVYLRREPGRAVVTWRALPVYGRAVRATAQLVLAADGSVSFRYGAVPPDAQRLRGLHPGPHTPVEAAALDGPPRAVEAALGVVEDRYRPALLAEHRRAAPLAGLMFASALLMLLAFPLYLRAGITQPLSRLLDGVRRVNAGDLTADVPVGVHDEIGRLTEDFNTMTGSLRRYATEMERLVAERTAALEEKSAALEQSLDDLHRTQAELVHQEKLAGLGRLTAGIAHEIKNPLNFVNNFAGLSAELVRELREELEASRGEPVEVVLPVLAPLLDDLAMNAEKVRAHGRRADAIVQEMMLHARGAHEPRQPVDLNALVAEHVGLAVGGWEEKNDDGGVAVTQAYDPAVGAVVCTPQALGRVLVNLVTNALDAVAARRALAGGEAPYAPAVAVSTHRVDGRVLIAVADNGVGIPEAAQRRLFEPFYTTKPPGRGNVGLGLSLSRDVVHGQGGTLEAESREGEGTTFTVTLPAGAA
ncbi:MAG TPA: ATP-binding protein [Rubricoccaceae bacterium]|nr:ATP-binding protein [Rubricoccaceae bacterium]